LEIPFIRLGILFCLIVLSAFFSGSETALFSFGEYGLAKLDKNSSIAKKISYLLNNTSRLLFSILVGNECINVAISTIIASIFVDYFGADNWQTALIYSITISTPLILIISEITPKALAIKEPKKVSILVAKPIYYLNLLIAPFFKLIDKVFFLSSQNKNSIKEKDFLNIVNISVENKKLEEDEKKLINNIFEFNDTVVEKIMTKKENVFFIREDTSFSKIISGIKETEYSRIPVLEKKSNFVLGVLYSKKILPYLELYKNNNLKDFNINNIIEPTISVTKKTKIYNVLKMLKKIKQHLCIVVDEHGDMAGIVTMEDLLEEIFGEIQDERDIEI